MTLRSHLLDESAWGNDEAWLDALIDNWLDYIRGGDPHAPGPVKSTFEILNNYMQRKRCEGEEVEIADDEETRADEIAGDLVERSVSWMAIYFPQHARILRGRYPGLSIPELRAVAEQHRIRRSGHWHALAKAMALPEDLEQRLFASRDILRNRVRQLLVTGGIR
jgi:hypothetical protein